MELIKLFIFENGTLGSILFPIFLGAMIAVIIVYINRLTYGKLIKKLFEAGANDEESAASLDELGIKNGFIIRRALKDGTTLRNIIEKTADSGGDSSLPAKFYIADGNRKRAEVLYSDSSSTVSIVIFCIFVLIIASLAAYATAPTLINGLSNLFK